MDHPINQLAQTIIIKTDDIQKFLYFSSILYALILPVMGILFGKPQKKNSRVSEQDKAILQLKQQRDKLKQYQKQLIRTLESERIMAKQLLKDGRKEKAKLILRKKKMMENMLSKTDVQLLNLEQMAHDVEFAQIEHKVLEGLKVGNESLKALHQVFSIEDIERIMDETQEGIEKQREIDEILGGKLTDEDEDAVMNELQSIIAESIPSPIETEPEKELRIDVAEQEEKLELPEVPDNEIGAPKKKIKTETRQLVAAM